MAQTLNVSTSHELNWVQSYPKLIFFADTEKQKALMRDDPIYYLKYRKAVESEMNAGFMGFHKNTPESTAAREVTRHPF